MADGRTFSLNMAPDPAPAGVIDPVCGMTIDTSTAAATSEHDGKTFHFCGMGCKQVFDQDPAAYATRST